MGRRYVWTWHSDWSGGPERTLLLLDQDNYVYAYIYAVEEKQRYWVAKILWKAAVAALSFPPDTSIDNQLFSQIWQKLGASADIEELKGMVERAVIPPLERLAWLKKTE